MKKAIGYYNEYLYTVDIDAKEVYKAGNSPYDSQGYVDKESGVGLEKMKEYCEKTTKEIAKEKHAKYIGIEYLEVEA